MARLNKNLICKKEKHDLALGWLPIIVQMVFVKRFFIVLTLCAYAFLWAIPMQDHCLDSSAVSELAAAFDIPEDADHCHHTTFVATVLQLSLPAKILVADRQS